MLILAILTELGGVTWKFPEFTFVIVVFAGAGFPLIVIAEMPQVEKVVDALTEQLLGNNKLASPTETEVDEAGFVSVNEIVSADETVVFAAKVVVVILAEDAA